MKWDQAAEDFLEQVRTASYKVSQDSRSTVRVGVVAGGGSPHTANMTDMNREEVKARTDASEAKVAAAIADMRVESEKLRGDMSAFKNDVLSAIAGVRTDHAKEQVVATRWAIGVLFSILLGAVGTIVTVVLRTGAPHVQQTAAQPAPIVIQVPPYQAATPQPAQPPASATTSGGKH